MKELEQLSKENRELKLAVNELSILNDIATSISTTQPIENIIDTIVLKCVKYLKTEEGTISLLTEEDDQQKFQTFIRKSDLTQARLPIQLDEQITGWMLNNKQPILSNDLVADSRFTLPQYIENTIQSMLSAPLIIKGKLIGYIAVFNKKHGEVFNDKDQRLLIIIASQSAQLIESSRLYKEEKELLLMKEELNVAKRIQNGLLPEKSPFVKGYLIAGSNSSAKEVGGDYFDFIKISENKFGFCIADITGKGMPAALLMSNLQALLRSQVMIEENVEKAISNVNNLLYQSTDSSKFATLFFAVLDSENHTITYCNAGHDEALVFRNGKHVESLQSTGLLLGVMPDMGYSTGTVELQPGDSLVCYTDGITEAMDENENEFGLQKMIDCIEGISEPSALKIEKTLLSEVKSHSRNVAQSDDITIIIIHRSV